MSALEEVEPYKEGLERRIAILSKKIGRPNDVTLTEGNASDLPTRSLPQVIAYDPLTSSHRTTGSPLLITALCADLAAWPRIHAAFAAEDFEPLTPEPVNGRVCYASRTKALVIVPAHPGATRAVEQTGRALLTSIIR